VRGPDDAVSAFVDEEAIALLGEFERAVCLVTRRMAQPRAARRSYGLIAFLMAGTRM
jgi:hypothetical protein